MFFRKSCEQEKVRSISHQEALSRPSQTQQLSEAAKAANQTEIIFPANEQYENRSKLLRYHYKRAAVCWYLCQSVTNVTNVTHFRVRVSIFAEKTHLGYSLMRASRPAVTFLRKSTSFQPLAGCSWRVYRQRSTRVPPHFIASANSRFMYLVREIARVRLRSLMPIWRVSRSK